MYKDLIVLQGNIQLKEGKFHYPTRRNVTVLNSMSIDIKVGFFAKISRKRREIYFQLRGNFNSQM
jgi:ABC-type bacteriocin/lantibiotic exporter with double-glycine peptidase domain